MLPVPRHILCCPPAPVKRRKAAGHLGLQFDPMVGDLGLRMFGHNLAGFATQDEACDPGIITHPYHDFGRKPLFVNLHYDKGAQL